MKQSPRDIRRSIRTISRRGLVLGGAQLAFVGALGLRMRYMQVDQADEYRLLAEDNRVNWQLIPPERGLIRDRDGFIVAENEQNYSIVLVREAAEDVDEVLSRLRRIVRISPGELERIRRDLDRRRPFVPVTVAENLTWEEFAAVAVNSPALPGVNPDVGLNRNYPMIEDYAHVVGYVGPVSDHDLAKYDNPDPLLRIPQFQIGKTGIEDKMESRLRGSAGTRQIEVNAAGRVMRELGKQEGQPGTNLQLTIDSMLQNYAQARMAGESASAVVMDVQTGDILALASAPAFDPNKFVRGISVADYAKLTDNEHRPLANKPVQGIYPPGSTFKLVTALAALKEGVVTEKSSILCHGHKQLGRRRFHCWEAEGHGEMNLEHSLSQSCDVYYYEVAEQTGIEKISAMARMLGLGKRYPLPLSAISRGLVPTMSWKEKNRHEKWVTGDTLNSGIGQGFVLASPIQLAVMATRIASGKAIEPRLVKAINDVETPLAEAPALDISPDHLRIVRKGMHTSVYDQDGTAIGSRIVAEGMQLAGKTGTSQVRSITAEERAEGVLRNEDLPWNRRDHALFVCFAPYDAPKFACSVVVEHGGGGARIAAPIARDIMLQALHGGTPPLSAYPEELRGLIRTQQENLKLRRMPPQTNAGSRA